MEVTPVLEKKFK